MHDGNIHFRCRFADRDIFYKNFKRAGLAAAGIRLGMKHMLVVPEAIRFRMVPVTSVEFILHLIRPEDADAYDADTDTWYEDAGTYDESTDTYVENKDTYDESADTYNESADTYNESADTTDDTYTDTSYDESADTASSDTYSEESYQDSYAETEASYNAPAPSSTGQAIADYACQFVGNPYVWGGTSLTEGADCSGFVMTVFANFGVSLPYNAASQSGYGSEVSVSDLAPGDLIFYGDGSGISHVAIYIGNGSIVHASNSASGICYSNALYSTPICCRRIV